jgi:nicotinamide phosphoribosyltransferase
MSQTQKPGIVVMAADNTAVGGVRKLTREEYIEYFGGTFQNQDYEAYVQEANNVTSNSPILAPNPIMRADSYKFSHPFVYRKGITGMFSYLEARIKDEVIVPFGAQMWAQKNLMQRITMAHIDEAEAFANAHGEPFQRSGWEKVVNVYNGYLPVKIRIVPEGMRVPSQNIIASVECDDPGVYWQSSQLETNMQRGIWYPTTIASNDYKSWRAIRRFALETCDDLNLVPFQLHDFGGRGVTCGEQAEIGGAAHLVFFMGSDTIEGVRAANFYYDNPMAAYSVPASEHTVQCSFGSLPWEQREYLLAMLTAFAKEGKIVSIVLDGYDVYREAQQIVDLKDVIIASGARVVLRPDSGDPMEVLPRLFKIIEAGFGSTKNTKGYRVINHIGFLQGDGVDYEAMVQILEMVTRLGYASSNIVFGSGGGLLQKVNRDTYKFAQKASAILMGVWKAIFKNPITDPGKKSKAGRLTLVRSRIMPTEFMTVDIDKPLDSEWEDVMVTLYEHNMTTASTTGQPIFNKVNLDEVRTRAQT